MPPREWLEGHRRDAVRALDACVDRRDEAGAMAELRELLTILDALAAVDALRALPLLIALALHGAAVGEA
jgi:hypothetical protein